MSQAWRFASPPSSLGAGATPLGRPCRGAFPRFFSAGYALSRDGPAGQPRPSRFPSCSLPRSSPSGAGPRTPQKSGGSAEAPFWPAREPPGTRVALRQGRETRRGEQTRRAGFPPLGEQVYLSDRFLLEVARWLDRDLSVFAECADLERVGRGEMASDSFRGIATACSPERPVIRGVITSPVTHHPEEASS